MANVDLSSLKFPGLSNTYVIPTEVAWVTYGTSTSAQIEAAYSSGKFVVCTMTGQNSEILMLPLVSRNSQTHHIFALSDGTGFVWADCDNDTWTDGENAIPLPQLFGTPQPLGTAAAGTSVMYSREDHVHAMPTAADVGAATEADVLKAYPTDTVTGAVANFPDGAALPAKNITVDIAPVQSGSGDPSPDNVRPITGWTGANVYRTGKNLWSLGNVSGTRAVAKSVFLPAGSYAFSTKNTTTAATETVRVIFTLADSTTAQINVTANATGRVSTTFNASKAITQAQFWAGSSAANSNGQTFEFSDIQFELGSTATAYEPYSGNTYTITFPNEAGTVYGGTLDVTNGKLTVTDGYIASYNGETIPGEWISSMDVYAAGTTPTIGAQVVYKLATPTTYNLTPQQIQLLLGVNNVWANTGDSIVNYYADTTLYIKKLTGSTEQDMIADSAISSGKYFLVGNRLFLSTTSIAAGAKLTPGTNCTETNLAAALNAINS